MMIGDARLAGNGVEEIGPGQDWRRDGCACGRIPFYASMIHYLEIFRVGVLLVFVLYPWIAACAYNLAEPPARHNRGTDRSEMQAGRPLAEH